MSQLRLQSTQNLRNLQLVPNRVQRQSAAPVAITAGVSLLVIVLLELLITIATSQGVYQIAALKAEKKNLVESTQILGSQVDSLSSPQNLSNAAAQLGMIANANPVFLSIEKQKVTGKPAAALAGYKNRISGNLVANAELIAQTSVEDLATISAPADSPVTAPTENAVKPNVATEPSAKSEVVSSQGRIPASPTN